MLRQRAGIALASALLCLLGACKTGGTTGPTTAPTIAPPTSAAPTTPAVFVLTEKTATEALTLIAREFGQKNVAIEFVKKGASGQPCIGDQPVAGNADSIFRCSDNRYAVPEAVGDPFPGEHPLIAWFTLGVDMATLMPGFDTSPDAQLCAGGRIARVSPAYSDAGLQELLAFIQQANPGAVKTVRGGVNAGSMNACK